MFKFWLGTTDIFQKYTITHKCYVLKHVLFCCLEFYFYFYFHLSFQAPKARDVLCTSMPGSSDAELLYLKSHRFSRAAWTYTRLQQRTPGSQSWTLSLWPRKTSWKGLWMGSRVLLCTGTSQNPVRSQQFRDFQGFSLHGWLDERPGVQQVYSNDPILPDWRSCQGKGHH